MKKVVLTLDIQNDKGKRKAMDALSALSSLAGGIDLMAMDTMEKKLTLIGNVDPVNVVNKLRKFVDAEIDYVVPWKEPQREIEEPKKEELKKEVTNKKVVLKLDIHDIKDKQKAMNALTSFAGGIDLTAINLREKKLTVRGKVDPVNVVNKLRKNFNAEICTVLPWEESGTKKE
ncbi:hypothetical protein NE237_012059 [Protea cynaroides]|uniref:HMA domain-containing protein n=1 Tax=Protea cynaroides TaxID=273540 RepID=A0A9Q0JXA6_9MAGN|nr:hypothetical protein NE237_012059 [Protea cynaroides]